MLNKTFLKTDGRPTIFKAKFGDSRQFIRCCIGHYRLLFSVADHFFVRWAKLYFFLRRWPTFSVLVDADTEWRPNIDKSTNLSITKWVFPYLFSISRRTTLCFFWTIVAIFTWLHIQQSGTCLCNWLTVTIPLWTSARWSTLLNGVHRNWLLRSQRSCFFNRRYEKNLFVFLPKKMS